MKKLNLSSEKPINWKNVIIGLSVGTGLIVVIIILRKFFGLFGDPSMSPEAKEKQRILNNIYVDEDDMTINTLSAGQRAENLDKALRGYSVNKYEVAKQLIHRKYWGLVEPKPKAEDITSIGWGLGILTAGSSIVANIEKYTLLERFKAFESYVSLDMADYEMIAKRFGVRMTSGFNFLGISGMSTKDWFTLKDWIYYEEDQELIELYEYIFRYTRVTV